MQTPSDSESDEANVGRGHHIDDKHEDLFEAGNGHQESGHEGAHGLLNAMSSHFVHSMGHVVRHGSHGAAHGLD